MPKKVETFCFGVLVKKISAYAGIRTRKASILPLNHERLNYATCELKQESCRPEKKHAHFPITLAYHKCNHDNVLLIFQYSMSAIVSRFRNRLFCLALKIGYFDSIQKSAILSRAKTAVLSCNTCTDFSSDNWNNIGLKTFLIEESSSNKIKRRI